jgi:hypothetical protein
MSMADDDNTNKAAVGTLDAFLKKRANDRFGRFLTETPNTLLGGGWRDADLGAAKQGDDKPKLIFPMPSDTDDFKIYPFSKLMERKPRESLVEHLLFKKGITTLVAQSGEGKTTLAASVAPLVAGGGTWCGKQIPRRPVLWIAGEGEEDLPGMIEAGAKQHGFDWKKLPLGIRYDEPVRFDNPWEVEKLIKWLTGKPAMLIVADALGDMMGMLDEDKAQHINQVYNQLRRVEKATGCVFLILHHQGWDNKRERGSSAIRGKSDIVVQILKLDPDEGWIKLKHLKRRGGAKLKEFAYEVKMHKVEMCLQPVPIVTGTLASPLVTEDLAADEGHARDLVRIVVAQPGPVSWTKLKKLSGKTKTTFGRGLNIAVDGEGWLIKGKGGYALNQDRSWEAALTQGPDPQGPPFKKEGGGPSGPSGPRSSGPKLDPVGPWTQTGEELPTAPVVNEVELEKADALLKKVVP